MLNSKYKNNRGDWMAIQYEDVVSVGAGSLAGRYLRMFWQPVFIGRLLELKRPQPIKILGEAFTIYRGETGIAHVVAPRCPHRGLSLAVARVMGDSLECFYHGWTFDACGQCVSQPAENPGFAHNVSIKSYPTTERNGLIFAYLGDGMQPNFPELNVFSEPCIIENKADVRPWPFFAQIENGIDETHFNFAHRRTKFDDIGMNNGLPELSCQETAYGILRIAKRGNALRKGHYIMPNWSLSSKYEHHEGWSNHIVWRVPTDDENHISFTSDVIYKTGSEAEVYRAALTEKSIRRDQMAPAIDVIRNVLAGKMHPDEIPKDHPDIVMIQDGVCCMGQPIRRSRGDDILGISDRQVSLLRRIWNRELEALRDGGTLKNWQIPQGLETTRGV